MNLYDLAVAYRRLADLDDEGFETALSQLEDRLEDRAESIVKLLRELHAAAAVYDVEEKLFAQKKQAAKARAERLMAYLSGALDTAGRSELRAGPFSLKFQDNPPAVEILDTSTLPAEFWRHKEPEPDKAKLLLAWRAGDPLPEGVMIRQGRSLRIR